MMYAITGITGQVGSAIAKILLDKKLPVRAVIRNQAKAKQWLDPALSKDFHAAPLSF